MLVFPSHTTVHAGPHTAVRLVRLGVHSRAFRSARRRERFGPFLGGRRSFTPTLLPKGQHSLVLLPLVTHELRHLLTTPINPLRGPFGPSSLPRLLRPMLTSATWSRWIASPSGSKITAFVLGWVEDSVLRSDSRGFAAAGLFLRCPEVSSTAFDAQLPDLQPVPLMDTDFAVTCPLVWHRMPQIRFLYIG